MSELKSSPFCGSPNVTVASAKHELSSLLYFGMCMRCASKGPRGFTVKEAASEWNLRAEVKGDGTAL